MTPEEKAIIKAEIDSQWAGVGADNIKQYMTAPGSAETEAWVTVPLSEGRVKLHKTLILVSISAEERAAIRALLASDTEAAKDFKMLYDSTDTFDVNDPVFIGMVDTLVSAIGLDASRALNIKRIGQRLKSRSEELIGRNVTVEEIREALI